MLLRPPSLECRTSPSVFWHRAIDSVRPGKNAALQINSSCKTFFLQKLLGLEAAHAALAVDDDLAIGVQFLETARQLRQGNQRAARKAANAVLLWVAHVEDKQVLATIQTAFELIDRGFGEVGRRRRGRRLLAAHAAELFVVNELGDGGLIAAHRALRVAANLEFLEGHLQCIVQQQPAYEGRAVAEQEFDRLGRLDAPNQSGENAQYSAFGTTRHLARRRRLGIKAAIAWPLGWMEYRCLAVETKNAAIDVRLLE